MPVIDWDELTVVVQGKTITINIRKIGSSNIEWIGWPKSGEPTMIVQFQGATRYAYLGVTRQKAVACCWAKSSGEFLAKRIKPHYEVVKLR